MTPFGTRREAVFYRLILPGLILANFALGLYSLTRLSPADWQGWLELSTGALCCVVSGWLLAASWSRSYWRQAMRGQLDRWMRIVDTMFGWLEEQPISVDAMRGLQRSVADVIAEEDIEVPMDPHNHERSTSTSLSRP